MSQLFEILNALSSLVSVVGSALLTFSFWKLHLFAPTTATRIGRIVAVIHLGIWLIHGTIQMIGMLPGGMGHFVYGIYQIPIFWEVVSLGGILSFATTLLCLAWSLHRGIYPVRPTP